MTNCQTTARLQAMTTLRDELKRMMRAAVAGEAEAGAYALRTAIDALDHQIEQLEDFREDDTDYQHTYRETDSEYVQLQNLKTGDLIRKHGYLLRLGQRTSTGNGLIRFEATILHSDRVDQKNPGTYPIIADSQAWFDRLTF